MEQEDFKIIEHKGVIFKCFRDGRVFRVKPSGIKQVGVTPKEACKGEGKFYYRIGIKGGEVKVHRLLAKAFLGLDIDDKTQVVDHIDGNGLNNSFENLRVVTQKENQRNMKNIRGVSTNRNRYKSSIIDHEGKRLYKSSKDINVVIAWRKEKEIEFGYLTRASCILSSQ